jgi:hypothetical protein
MPNCLCYQAVTAPRSPFATESLTVVFGLLRQLSQQDGKQTFGSELLNSTAIFGNTRKFP